MRAARCTLCLALAAAALAAPWSLASATPDDPASARRSARIPAVFVPAVDPDEVPGFTIKMRGERIVYCRSEVKIGTRFKTETCIDEAHMPAYLAALEENRQLLRSIRTGENRIN